MCRYILYYLMYILILHLANTSLDLRALTLHYEQLIFCHRLFCFVQNRDLYLRQKKILFSIYPESCSSRNSIFDNQSN